MVKGKARRMEKAISDAGMWIIERDWKCGAETVPYMARDGNTVVLVGTKSGEFDFEKCYYKAMQLTGCLSSRHDVMFGATWYKGIEEVHV